MVALASGSRFLFVHGAWHGAWSFDLLRLELDRRRVGSEAIDLPSLGDDPTPCVEATFDAGVEHIVDRLGTRRNWTLVGHSFGGFYVTEAALRASGKVRNVVYLAGYVPNAGDDWKTINDLAPATDEFRASFRKDEDAKTLVLDAARAGKLLYHDVAPGIGAAACARLKPQPVEPIDGAKIDGSAKVLEKIPRTAVIGDRDLVLRAADLTALAVRAKVAIEKVPTGHCPFLSAPKRIADLLLGVKS